MRLYVLAESSNLAEPTLPVFQDTHVCWVKGGDWFEARWRALQHARDRGVDTIGILAGSCELYHRPHWNGKGPESKHARAHPYHQNGMWLYMQRLARRYAHVYVPPLAALRPWTSLLKHPWEYECNPVPACCAMYRVQAVLDSVLDKSGPWGHSLCSNGFDSLTVSDFFVRDIGGRTLLDETGSIKTWKRAYEHAIHSHL